MSIVKDRRKVRSHLDDAIMKAQRSQLENFRKVLTEIACMGDGIKAEIIDWANIGKGAKCKANEAIRPRCSKCGK